MSIDSLSRLISSADVTEFRSIVNHFLPMIGWTEADYCDGPYDGGKDFRLVQSDGGTQIAIQISTEGKWESKIKKEAEKVKNNYSVDHLIFISSQRIPEKSFQNIQDSVLQEKGVSVNRHDCQSIASRFIKEDAIKKIITALGMELSDIHEQKFDRFLSKKSEAITSLLIFGQDSKDLREELYESIIKNSLAGQKTKISREHLISRIISDYGLNSEMRTFVSGRVDRLIQRGEIKSPSNNLSLSPQEQAKFSGLTSLSKYQFQKFQNEFSEYVIEKLEDIDKTTKNILTENFLDLVIGLSKTNPNNNQSTISASYSKIFNIVSARVGAEKADSVFIDLSQFVASSDFVKQLACVNLYERFVTTESKDLINALGGTESLDVFIESSVFIPMLCNLLFEGTSNRASRSATNLYELIVNNGFKAIIPDVYVEEAAAHLIQACQKYKYILDNPEVDLAYSGNAFASHYSMLKKSRPDFSFPFYVKSFGLNLNQISQDMDDLVFYRIRDRVSREIGNIAAGYGFEILQTNGPGLYRKIDQLKEISEEQNQYKADVLIEHDAKVVCYLSNPSLPSGVARVLCTWEKSHFVVNQDGSEGYFVMSPVALIDYLSLSSPFADSIPVSQLIDFALLQSENHLQKASVIWDVIADFEKDGFSDAEFVVKAREFIDSYMDSHAHQEPLNRDEVQKEWLAWKRIN